MRRAYTCVSVIAMRNVPCPISTAFNEMGTPIHGKKLSIATPVTMPGKVRGKRTMRSRSRTSISGI